MHLTFKKNSKKNSSEETEKESCFLETVCHIGKHGGGSVTVWELVSLIGNDY